MTTNKEAIKLIHKCRLKVRGAEMQIYYEEDITELSVAVDR